MNPHDLHIVFAVGGITLMALAPVIAWPHTRPLTPVVLAGYVLFLWSQWDVVAGAVAPFHDTAWNLEGWSALIQQWVYAGEPLGWNPYLGAGQPFALYNNVLSSLPSVFFAGLFQTMGLPLDPAQNFKLIWIFGHLNICTGSLLFFRILFRENWVCLAGFASMLFGGLFFLELGQGVAIYSMSFLPYMLFFLIWFYRERTWTPLLLFSLFFGFAVNYYIPTYLIYTLVLFFLAALLVRGYEDRQALKQDVRSLFKVLAARPGLLALAVVLFVLAASPMLFNYQEMQDYASPTRGFSMEGGRLTEESYQTEVLIRTYAYRFLANPSSERSDPGLFYIGLLPCIALMASLFVGGQRLFLTLAGFLIVLSAHDLFGFQFWKWIRPHLPLGETLRHTLIFGRLIAFFLLTASLAGLLALKTGSASMPRKIGAIAFGMAFWSMVGWGDWTLLHKLMMGLAGMALLALAAGARFPKQRVTPLCLGLVLSLHAFDMVGHAWQRAIPQIPFWNQYPFPRDYRMNPIAYPTHWRVRPQESIPVPQYFQSIYNKEAVWSNLFPNTMLWLQKDLTLFLLQENFLKRGVNSFKPKTYDHLVLKQAEGDLFYALPARDGVEVETLAAQALDRILSLADVPPVAPGTGTGEPRSLNRNDPVFMTGKDVLVQRPSASSNRVTLDLHLPQAAYILRMENYHADWTATLDGRQVAIARVSPNFQTVFVPAGNHTLTFQFESLYPTLVLVHIVTGVLTAMVLLLWLGGFNLRAARQTLSRIRGGAKAGS